MKTVLLTGSASRRGGGMFTSVRRLAGSLSDKGVNVEVMALWDEYSAMDIPHWGDNRPELFSVSWPCSWGYAPDLLSRLCESNADIVHTQGLWLYISVAAIKWARRMQALRMVSPRGMLDPWALQRSRWKKRIAAIFYENQHLHGADCLHALTESEYRAIRDFGLRNPVCIIPNGADIPPVKPSAEPPWRDRVKKGQKVLFYVGRIHPKKGLSNLLAAWKQVKEQAGSAGWVLAIAGWNQGNHEEILRRAALELGVNDSVLFCGPLFHEQRDAAYANADAFIVPSFSEGLPMVVLEAWAHGLPVLMTPQCNLPEGFTAGAALQIQPEDSAIASGMVSLFGLSENQRKNMGLNGMELIRQKFNWQRIAADMHAVYLWIMGGGQPPPCVRLD